MPYKFREELLKDGSLEKLKKEVYE